MAFKIKVKKGTSAPASGALDSGELGYNTSANIFYVGNGTGNAATEIITNSSTAQTKVGDFTTQGKLGGEYLALETLTGSSPTAGQLTYDSDTGTFRAGIYGDYVLDLGEKSVFFIENVSGSTIAKGAVVGFAGASGDHLRGAAFTANSSANPNYIMGIADQSIPHNGFGFVVHFGKVRGIDTSAYAPGTLLYASPATAGAFTSTEPTAPNLKLPIGAVVKQNGSSGIIQVRMKTGEKLSTLHDVNISSVASGELLTYDGSKWVNSTTVSGSTRFSNDLNYFGLETGNNEAEIVINTGNGGHPQIGFTDNGDVSWAIGADDIDNSFKIHGVATSTIPTIGGLETPHLEIDTTGNMYVQKRVYLTNNAYIEYNNINDSIDFFFN